MVRVRQAPGRTSTRRDSGAVAVEFALLFPLLFFLLFGTLVFGWRVWEHQAAQATAREAARLASLGIYSTDAYRHEVVCLGERSGLHPGTLTTIDITLYDHSLLPTSAPAYGGYVRVALTYRSTFGAIPMITDDAGTFITSGLNRIEQVDGVAPQTLAADGERCG